MHVKSSEHELEHPVILNFTVPSCLLIVKFDLCPNIYQNLGASLKLLVPES